MLADMCTTGNAAAILDATSTSLLQPQMLASKQPAQVTTPASKQQTQHVATVGALMNHLAPMCKLGEVAVAAYNPAAASARNQAIDHTPTASAVLAYARQLCQVISSAVDIPSSSRVKPTAGLTMPPLLSLLQVMCQAATAEAVTTCAAAAMLPPPGSAEAAGACNMGSAAPGNNVGSRGHSGGAVSASPTPANQAWLSCARDTLKEVVALLGSHSSLRDGMVSWHAPGQQTSHCVHIDMP